MPCDALFIWAWKKNFKIFPKGIYSYYLNMSHCILSNIAGAKFQKFQFTHGNYTAWRISVTLRTLGNQELLLAG